MRMRYLGATLGLSLALLAASACDKEAPAPAIETRAPRAEADVPTGAAAAAALAPAAPKGHVIAPADGGFTITFPPGPKPKETTQKVPTEAGELVTRVWMAERTSDAFAINITDLPADLAAGGDPIKYIDGGMKGMVSSIPGGTVDAQEGFKLNGYDGKRFRYHGSYEGQSIFVRAAIVYAPPRSFQLQYIADRATALSAPQANTFFDSLTLIASHSAYVDEAAGYRVTFPPSFPAPSRKTEDLDTALGKLPMTLSMSTTPKGALGAAVFTVPGDEPIGDTNFDDARDGLLRSTSAKLIREEKATFKGAHPGRRFLFSGSLGENTFFGRAEMFTVGRKIFLVQGLAPTEEQLGAPQVRDFFDSLEVIAAAAP